MQIASRSQKKPLVILWVIAIAVTVGAICMRRSAGALAWENYTAIAPSTLSDNEAFYRDLSLGGIALGVGLILIATWRTVKR